MVTSRQLSVVAFLGIPRFLFLSGVLSVVPLCFLCSAGVVLGNLLRAPTFVPRCGFATPWETQRVVLGHISFVRVTQTMVWFLIQDGVCTKTSKNEEGMS